MNRSTATDMLATLHRTSAEILHDIAFFLNLMLLVLVMTRSRFHIKAYKRILSVSCLSDLLLAGCAILCRPVCFVSGGYMLVISESFFSANYSFAFWTTLAWISALHANIVGVAVQFGYRYRFVCLRTTQHTAKSVFLLIVLPVAYCLVATYVIALTITPVGNYPAQAQRILREIPWHRPDGTAPYVFGSHIMRPVMALYSAMFTLTAVGAYSVVVWTELKMMAFINSHGHAMLESTRRMHAEVHRALIATALSPLLACGPVVFFVSCFVFKLAPGPMTAFMISVYNMIALVNPIMQIYFVRTYREAVLNAAWCLRHGLRRKPNMISPTTCVNGLSAATSIDDANGNAAR